MTQASFQQRLNHGIVRLKDFFETTLWRDIPEQARLLQRLWINALRVIYLMVRELAAGQLNLRAMSLVFTTLLSLVPLIAVAFSVLKAFGVHNQIEPLLLGLLEPLGERGPEITANIIGFVENIRVGVLGSLGLALLFYTIIALIQKVENSFNYVWRVKHPRSLARRFTDYLSVLMIGPVLVFSALGVAATVLSHDLMQTLRAIEPFGTLIVMLGKVLPYVMIILAFTFLYKFIPNTKVKLGPALVGATVAGILWITVGTIFATFVASSSNYTAIYSSFAILFFFMIWLYLAWFILLTGSQVAFYMQHPKLVQLAGRPIMLSARLREKEGLSMMTVIARHFLEHRPPLSIQQLEEETGLTTNAVQDLLYTLEQGALLAELAGDVSRYVPAQDIATIRVADILHCLRTAEEHTPMSVKTHADPHVETLLEQMEQAKQAVLGDLTLRELVLQEPEDG